MKNTLYSVTLSRENLASITAALTAIALTGIEEEEELAVVTAVSALEAIEKTLTPIK